VNKEELRAGTNKFIRTTPHKYRQNNKKEFEDQYKVIFCFIQVLFISRLPLRYLLIYKIDTPKPLLIPIPGSILTTKLPNRKHVHLDPR
jgi:hypothetical protein